MRRFGDHPFGKSALLILLALLAFPSTAGATDWDAEARERFERALKLYEDGAYDAALVELNRAWELRPSFKLLYNIAQVRLAMNDYAAALDAYKGYLEKGGDKIPSARRDAVQKEIAKLEHRVARVTVETDVAGAEVFVDDVSMGTTPLAAPLIVNSGIRRVVVRHPEYVPQSQRVSLAGGTQQKIRFSLTGNAPSAGNATAPTTAQPAEPPLPQSAPAISSAAPAATHAPQPLTHVPAAVLAPRREAKVPWVGWALTGAFAAGAGVVGLVTLSKNESLNNERERLGTPPDRVDHDATQVRTLAIVTDALLVGAISAGAVSLWLTLDSGESRGTAQPRTGSRATALAVSVGPAGVRARLTY